jgi:hypothetical protein
MKHRFCIVASGDFGGTPKIAETVAIAAAGGCLPLFVIPKSISAARAILPYTSWLDYCDISFVISEDKARREMLLAVDKLLQVSAERAELMRENLRQLSAAFIFNTQESPGQQNMSRAVPSAVDYILSEACKVARANLSGRADRSRLVTPKVVRMEAPRYSLQRCSI